MNRPDWDQYFMTMAYLAASRSTDQSTHAGTVIVRPDNSVVTTGYNGAVRGEENPPQERPEKYFYFEHSERNAIYTAARHGTNLEGCKLYVNFLPCADCARAIVQSGIKEVIVHKEGQESFLGEAIDDNNWDDSHKATMRIFNMKPVANGLVYDDEVSQVIADKLPGIVDKLHAEGEFSILRWWSGELHMPKGYFRSKEFDL